MKKTVTTLLAFSLLLAGAAFLPAAEVGEPAPEFTLMGSDGNEYSLSDFEGQFVVLEWVNHGCPFVRKFYGAGEMQRLQKEYTEQDVAWLTINTSAPGKQGHMTAEQANESIETYEAHPTAILLDHDGTVGKRFDARVTPHMYVIDPDGTLIYNGAIDDSPTTDPADLEGAENYVVAALAAGMNGEEVANARTRPYGCGMKYAD